MRYGSLVIAASILFASNASVLCVLSNEMISDLVTGDIAKLKKSKGFATKIKERDPGGKTALHYIVLSGNIPGVKELIGMKLVVDAKDKEGRTPLLSMYQSPLSNKNPKAFFEIGKFLVSKGADPKILDSKTKANVLHYIAPVNEKLEDFKFFVDKGADINQVAVIGQQEATPVSMVFTYFSADIAKHITEKVTEGLEVTEKSLDLATKGLAAMKKTFDEKILQQEGMIARLPAEVKKESGSAIRAEIGKAKVEFNKKYAVMPTLLNNLKAAVATLRQAQDSAKASTDRQDDRVKEGKVAKKTGFAVKKKKDKK